MQSKFLPYDQYMSLSKDQRRAYKKSIGYNPFKKSKKQNKKKYSYIKGKGDYVYSNYGPGAVNVTSSGKILKGLDPPSFSKSNDCVISHREYIGDVVTSSVAGNFSITSYPIQPGWQVSFPWLSTLAANYMEYEILQMVYEFRTMSADALNSTNTALGQVIMATEYNAALPGPINKQQMEQMEFSQSIKPSCSAIHTIECKKSQTPITHLYVRGGAQPANTDIRWSDYGNFYIATNGMQGTNVNVGELWVSYKIKFYKPILQQNQADVDAWICHAQASTGVTTSAYFGTNTSVTPLSNLPLVIGTTTLTFPSYVNAGNFIINYVVTQSSAAGTGPSIAATSGCTALKLLNNDSVALFQSNGSGTQVGSMYYVTITSPNAVITFSSGTFGGTVSAMDLIVAEIQSNIN